MTVSTIYASTSNYGYTVADDADWATVRAVSTGESYGSSIGFGSYYVDSLYKIKQGYIDFNVSSITGEVSASTLTLYLTLFGTGDNLYGHEIRELNHGSIGADDHSSYTELGSLQSLFYTSIVMGSGSRTFTASSSTTYDRIETLSTLGVVVNTVRNRVGTTPTLDGEYLASSPTDATYKPYLTVTWANTITGTAAANLSLTATALGTSFTPGTAAASLGGVTAAASGTVTHLSASTLAGELTASATGVVTHVGTAEVTASLTAGAAGIRETFGTSSFTSSISAEGVGAPEKLGTSSFSASLTSIANGTRTVVGNASFVSTESMSANGTVTRSGTASLAGSMQASAVGLRTVYGTATFTASLTASAGTRTPMYVFTYTSSVAVGGTTHTTTIGGTTQGAAMGDNTDSAASSMIREAF